MANCENPFCSWPEKGCVLKEAIEKSISLEDLVSQWNTWVVYCPNKGELFPRYQERVEELSKATKP